MPSPRRMLVSQGEQASRNASSSPLSPCCPQQGVHLQSWTGSLQGSPASAQGDQSRHYMGRHSNSNNWLHRVSQG